MKTMTVEKNEINELLEGVTRDDIFTGAFNRKQYWKLVKNLPHIDICDLSICFFVKNKDDKCLLLNRHLLESLTGAVEEGLCGIAEKNSPMKMAPVDQILAEETPGETVSGSGLWVVQTPLHTAYGAGAIVYPHFFEEVTKRVGERFWILPSSRCELLVIADDGKMKEDQLFDMVREINRYEVTPQEFLSDNIYRWNGHVLTDHFGNETVFEEEV